MSSWLKITGTQVGKFVLGLTGVTLKNNSGNLQVRNNADTAFADTATQTISLNNNGTGYNVAISTSGSQTGSYALTLPVDDGSPGQVLATDGSGVLSWASAASTASSWKVDSTSFAFGSSSTITAFTLPANAVVDRVTVIVDSAFDGTPTMSVGVSGGSASQYVGTGDVALTVADRYDVPYQGQADASSEGIEIYYTAGGASAGAGRVLVTYAVPA
jgi:hypothetical protein